MGKSKKIIIGLGFYFCSSDDIIYVKYTKNTKCITLCVDTAFLKGVCFGQWNIRRAYLHNGDCPLTVLVPIVM